MGNYFKRIYIIASPRVRILIRPRVRRGQSHTYLNSGTRSTFLSPYHFQVSLIAYFHFVSFVQSSVAAQDTVIMFSKSTWLTLFAASLSIISPVAAASDVLDLTAADFDEALKEYPLVLAEFFAPWVR